jgi:hypothetical protein
MFFILEQTPSVFVLILIVVVVSVVCAFRMPRNSPIDVAVAASALGAVAYLVLHTVVRGPAPLFVIGLGFTFFFYLPVSFLTGLACRVLFRRKLHLVRGSRTED